MRSAGHETLRKGRQSEIRLRTASRKNGDVFFYPKGELWADKSCPAFATIGIYRCKVAFFLAA
jgi:hypothetical protein